MRKTWTLILMLACLLMAGYAPLRAAAPAGPFTADDNTLLLLHFDGDLTDASAGTHSVAFSQIAGFTDPSFAAGQSGFGQALSGTGLTTTMNGCVMDSALSQIPAGPLTAEAWMYVPAEDAAAEMSNTVIDLAAGRFQFVVRFAGGGDVNIYPTLYIYNGTEFQSNYGLVTPADGWTYGQWHHFAVTYDVTRDVAVEFFFDGKLMPLGNTGQPAIATQWERAAEMALTGGRVWPPAAPSDNLMDLAGSIDELRLSSSIRYGTGAGDGTLLHLSFDGDLTDSSSYGWPVSFSEISGFGDLTFTAGQTGYGQALTANGGAVNGVVVTNGSLSELAAPPLTIEAMMMVPVEKANDEITNALIDLAAGRLNVRVRFPGGGDPNVYVHFDIYTDPGDGNLVSQGNYSRIEPKDGWAYGEWHKFAVTYDPARTGKAVEFFFDDQLMPKFEVTGVDPVTADFDRVAEPVMTAGRVWAPSAPTVNLLPLNGYIDEVKLSQGILYEAPASQAGVIDADYCEQPLTIDGDPSDWAALQSQVMDLDTGGRADLVCSLKLAWDADFLYMLVQESAGDTTQDEAASDLEFGTNASEMGPWNFDAVSMWFDLDNSDDNESIREFNPWYGFSSAGRTDLYTARLNNQDTLLITPFLNGATATGGTFAGDNRVIEAKVKWSDLASTVNSDRQPGGDLMAAVKHGYQFGCEPLLIDDDWNGQSFIGGSQYTAPSGTDANSRDIRLIGGIINAASGWAIYE